MIVVVVVVVVVFDVVGLDYAFGAINPFFSSKFYFFHFYVQVFCLLDTCAPRACSTHSDQKRARGSEVQIRSSGKPSPDRCSARSLSTEGCLFVCLSLTWG